MVLTDVAHEVRRMVLQLERDVVARAQLRLLLTTADTLVVGDRVQLRALRARLKRPLPKR